MNVTLLQELVPGSTRLQPELLPELTVLTGQIVTCDPLVPHTEPLEQQIEPGIYPVYIWNEPQEQRIAAAELRLSERPAVRWELATRVGQRIEELAEGHIFGYPVDTGLGCFADREAIVGMEQMEHKLAEQLGDDFISFYDDALADLLEEHEDNWANLAVDEATGLNVVIFSSGYGDGFYASYWGFDEAGYPVSLVTDFRVLGDEV